MSNLSIGLDSIICRNLSEKYLFLCCFYLSSLRVLFTIVPYKCCKFSQIEMLFQIMILIIVEC